MRTNSPWMIVALSVATFESSPPALAQSTERVSLDSAGLEGNGNSGFLGQGISVSADGRFVAFESEASNLVLNDSAGNWDVFVRDRQLGTTERVSVDSAATEGNGDSHVPAISADGRFVVFRSQASNLVGSDTNGFYDVFLHDRLNATTEMISVDTAGTQCNSNCFAPSVSADGRFVAYYTSASNLVAGDTNGVRDIFVRDRVLGTTERVSLDSGGLQANGASEDHALSTDGRYVVFESLASNLVLGDTNAASDIFIRDLLLGTTERLSLDSSGAQVSGLSANPRCSADARFVAFQSFSAGLVAGDTNALPDIFVRDRQTGVTTRVSVDSSGVQSNQLSNYPVISADGRFVAFESNATNLVAADTNAVSDVFLRDRNMNVTARMSIDTALVQGNASSSGAALSGDGRFVAFQSNATNLVAGDTNALTDVFARDRGAAPVSYCSPGLAGVIACPCSNPPSGPERGCDNSAGTGGAWISAGGSSSLAADTLVFTTGSEKPTATSIVLQGTTASATGIVFGQGVRCVAGLLKRLYVKTASGGSISAPTGSDPSVSVRSASVGDPLSAGAHRYYMVYYRDPIVLGGCSAASTFNATDSLDVQWVP